MSVLSEINRIKSAVTAIINAIRDKGVTVPTNAKITDLAPLISNIKTGASIATCTINVEFKITPDCGFVGATTFANGTMSRFNSIQNTTGTITIPNVVCGSALFIYVGRMSSVYGWTYGNDINGDAYAHVLSAPSTAGEYTVEIGELDD